MWSGCGKRRNPLSKQRVAHASAHCHFWQKGTIFISILKANQGRFRPWMRNHPHIFSLV